MIRPASECCRRLAIAEQTERKPRRSLFDIPSPLLIYVNLDPAAMPRYS